MSLARARQAVECLRDSLGEDLSSSSLVLSDNGSVLADYDGLVDLLRGGQGVLNVVSMANMVAELSTMMDEPHETSEKVTRTA